MSLTAAVCSVNGRPMLAINGRPTTETWCYGDPNAILDFTAAGLRICQFHVPFPSWWVGPGTYDLEPIDAKIAEFLALAPDILLIPRVNFGYVGEAWWAKEHPEELAVGCDLDGRPVDYEKIRVRPVDCWFSSGSELWTREASAAMQALVEHCEARFGDHILGYQIGGGISAEWFRWWNFVDEVYEDYSRPALDSFRRFLRRRYTTDGSLRRAWGREDISLETACVPPPRRLHEPRFGFFRDPAHERDVIDWLECLSYNNSSQIMALAGAAKLGCGNRKLVGTFYGYFWPHWNTQSAARSGHMDLRRMLQCESIDFISSPYHYDNRHREGFHHSQTVPQTIERAGKLHVDEIDTFTHLVRHEKLDGPWPNLARDTAESCALLRRDAATMLGTAGTAWWMDLYGDRWYADPQIQSEVLSLQQLAMQSIRWPMESHARAALVVDDRSYAWSSLSSPLNQYFSSSGRQLEWSALGFPVDTLMPFEIAAHADYKLYVFLNCWLLDEDRRREVLAAVRRPGVTSIWFYGCGFSDGTRCGDASVSELAGMRVRMVSDPGAPEVELLSQGHPLISETHIIPRGRARFGAVLSPEQTQALIHGRGFDRDAAVGPRFVVDDPSAITLGTTVGDGRPGLAMIERDGWRSIYCGAPLLPGWLLRRIAMLSDVHFYTHAEAQVFHRGPLLSVYKPGGGNAVLNAPTGQGLRALIPSRERPWEPDPSTRPAAEMRATFGPDETRFYLVG